MSTGLRYEDDRDERRLVFCESLPMLAHDRRAGTCAKSLQGGTDLTPIWRHSCQRSARSASRTEPVRGGPARCHSCRRCGEFRATDRCACSSSYPYLKVDWSSSLGSQRDGADRLYSEEAAGRHLTDVPFIFAIRRSDLIDGEQYGGALSGHRLRNAFCRNTDASWDPENRFTPSFWDVNSMVYNTSPRPAGQSAEAMAGSLRIPSSRAIYLSIRSSPECRRISRPCSATSRRLIFFKCLRANKPIIQRGYSQRFLLMMAGDHMVVSDAYVYQVIGGKEQKCHCSGRHGHHGAVSGKFWRLASSIGIPNIPMRRRALYRLAAVRQNRRIISCRNRVDPWPSSIRSCRMTPPLSSCTHPAQRAEPIRSLPEWRHYVEGTP